MSTGNTLEENVDAPVDHSNPSSPRVSNSSSNQAIEPVPGPVYRLYSQSPKPDGVDNNLVSLVDDLGQSPLATLHSQLNRPLLGPLENQLSSDNSTHVKDEKDQIVDKSPTTLAKAWIWEIISVILAILVLVGVVLLLVHYNGKPLPEWPTRLTLNTVLSIFSIALRALLMVVVAEGLSQLKWIWFLHPRPLSHLGRFDASSRGIFGAIKLLPVLGLNHFAILGIVIMFIAIAIGPFTQQSIRYEFCQRSTNLPSLQSSLPRAQFLSTQMITTNGAGVASLSFKGTVVEGLMFPESTNTSPAFNCPTGNCTYPFHSSLASCFTCTNAIYNVTHECGDVAKGCESTLNLDGNTINITFGSLHEGQAIVGGAVATLPNGTQVTSNHSRVADTFPFPNTWDVMAADAFANDHNPGAKMVRFGLLYYTNAPCSEDWWDNDGTGSKQPNDCISSTNAYGSNIISTINTQVKTDILWPNIGASVCEIDWCVSNFNSSVQDHVFSEQVTTTTAFKAIQVSQAVGTSQVVMVTDPCYIDEEPLPLDQVTSNNTEKPGFITVNYGDINAPWKSLTVRQECVFNVSSDVGVTVSSILQTQGLASVSNTTKSIFTGVGLLPGTNKGVVNKTQGGAQFQPIWLEPFFNGGNANFVTINATVAADRKSVV